MERNLWNDPIRQSNRTLKSLMDSLQLSLGPLDHGTAYGSSKAAVVKYTESLSYELENTETAAVVPRASNTTIYSPRSAKGRKTREISAIDRAYLSSWGNRFEKESISGSSKSVSRFSRVGLCHFTVT